MPEILSLSPWPAAAALLGLCLALLAAPPLVPRLARLSRAARASFVQAHRSALACGLLIQMCACGTLPPADVAPAAARTVTCTVY